MMRFVVYDSTGKILRWGLCSDEDTLNAQATNPGETALRVPDSGSWGDLEQGCYVDSSGLLQVRTVLAVSCPATAPIGSAITLSAPAGAAVTIDGVSVGTIDSTGSDTLTFSDAGAYTVAVALWPFVDASFEVVAS